MKEQSAILKIITKEIEIWSISYAEIQLKSDRPGLMHAQSNSCYVICAQKHYNHFFSVKDITKNSTKALHNKFFRHYQDCISTLLMLQRESYSYNLARRVTEWVRGRETATYIYTVAYSCHKSRPYSRERWGNVVLVRALRDARVTRCARARTRIVTSQETGGTKSTGEIYR